MKLNTRTCLNITLFTLLVLFVFSCAEAEKSDQLGSSIEDLAGIDSEQQAFIKAVNNVDLNSADDSFGNAVSINGDTLAVSAQWEDSNQTTITNGTSASTDNSITTSGAVYIYKRTDGAWAQEAYIKAKNNDSSGDGEERFGFSISLDGDTLAVSAYQEDSNQTTITNGTGASSDNSSKDSGAVYIYKRTGTEWAQQAYIKAKNNESSDFFGVSISLSGDTLAVGAYSDDSAYTGIINGTDVSTDNGMQNSGAVFVYKRSGNWWTQEAFIKASNNDTTDDYFGIKVSLNGGTLAVSARLEDSNQATITNGTGASSDNSIQDSGAVYVYKRTGTDWVQEAYIKASNNDGSETKDYFGWSISLYGDTLAVGARSEDSNQNSITNGTGASSDNNNKDSGAVYVYRRTGSSWAQQAYIKASNNDGVNVDDFFGASLSLYDDTLVVGAFKEDSNETTYTSGTTASDDNSNVDSGAVYVYSRTGDSWAQTAYVKAANNDDSTVTQDYFGYAVSIDDETLAIGAIYEDSNQNTITNGSGTSADNSYENSGAVYVYTIPD